MSELTNLNTAKVEELTGLPGIGSAMAERIIANRPYEKIEDLLKVSGIGPSLFESLAPLVSVADGDTDKEEDEEVIYLGPDTETEPEKIEAGVETDAPEQSQKEETLPSWEGPELEEEEESENEAQDVLEEEPAEEAEETEEIISREKAIVPVVEEEEKPEEKTKKEPKPITWGRAFLLAAACSFVAFILAVLLSLGILGSLNNGLRYASTDQTQAIYRQIEAINGEINLLNEDIEGLRGRLDNLESLSGRVGELEVETEGLSTDMATMTQELQGVKDQISEFMDSAERFQVFLNGLGDLLDTLSEGPEEVP